MKAIPSTFLFLLSLLSTTLAETPPSKNAVRLSNVQTLTLRADRETSHRRVSPLPQLKCVGPQNVCNLYQIDTMRCKNQGYDYDEEDIQWSCTADLPPEFKLGSTDVICEGYRNPDDKWILKGSCGVEYRLLLTEKGEEKYARWRQSTSQQKQKEGGDSESNISGLVFMIIFIAVLFFIAISISRGNNRGVGSGRRPGNNRQGGGSGGGGGGDDDDDPPPPYDYKPQSQQKKSNLGGPGFWTGAAAGGAAAGLAGYAMGRRDNRQQDRETRAGPSYTRRNDYDHRDDPGPAPPSFSPPRSNTGFGSTKRR